MTDDDMDARLRAAGDRWRSAHETTATADLTAATTPTVAHPAPPKTPRRHWTLLASAAAIAAALVVGGAFVLRGTGDGTGTAADTAPLENTVWLLTGQPGTTSSAILQIKDGELVADDDCRLFTGKADVQGSTLTVTHQVVRYKSCVDQYGPGYYEQGTKVLDGASTFALGDDGLTVSKDGHTLDFTPAPDAAAAPMADYPTFAATPWLLVSAKDANGDPVTVAGDPTVQFTPDGKLSGSDGCNSLSGTFTNDIPRITFGNVGGTEAYCPGDRGATENAVLALMQGAVDVNVSSGELTLAKDNAELVYRWNPEPSASNDPQNLYGKRWLLSGAGVLPAGYLVVTAEDPAVDVERGTLTVTGPTDDPMLKSLGRSPDVWSIVDGRLRIVLDNAQGRAEVFEDEAASEPAPLAGTDWQLTAASDGSTTQPATVGQSLKITGDQLVANDGVNSLNGAAAFDDATLTLSGVSTTDIGAIDPDPARDLIDAVLADGDIDYAISGDTLTLTRGANVLTYQARPPTADATLAGSWDLSTIEQGAGPDGSATNASAAGPFVFDHAVGQVTFGACNRAVVHVTAATLSFESWDLNTLKSCIYPSLDPGQSSYVFGQVLTGETTYSIAGDTLTITKDGVGAVVLTKTN